VAVAVPALESDPAAGPYWAQHAAVVVRACRDLPADAPLILAGHSGGGMLLPAIRQALGQSVAAYLFVDAGIPQDGKSRLDLFEDRAAADAFRQAAVDGLLPTWTADDLAGVIPDPATRHRFVAELRPLPLAVYEEPIPVFAGWPDAPAAYLYFSPPYAPALAEARRRGWPTRELPAGHFHMLIDPAGVAGAMMDLAEVLGSV
jgi:hypothetical protein